MTARKEQVQAIIEMALCYIEMAETKSVLDSLGLEIADLKAELSIESKDLDQVKTAYVRRSKRIQEIGEKQSG